MDKQITVMSIVLILFITWGVLYVTPLILNSEKSTITLQQANFAIEHAYFEGQKDALTGDVRIQWLYSDSCYIWTRSPWDDGRTPQYKPTITDSRRR